MDIRKILHGFHRHGAELGFVVSWFCGLLSGIVMALHTDYAFFDPIRQISSSQLSAAGVILATFLPFAIAACVSRLCHPGWLALIAGLRMFAFAYISMAIHIVFSSAGWLFCLLLQFGSILSLPLFCWFCIRRVSGRAGLLKTDILITCSFTVAIAAVDLYLIAPLLGTIAEF